MLKLLPQLNPHYVLIYPFINITIVDVIGPIRPQINKIIVDFGVRVASWGVPGAARKVFKLNNRSKHHYNTKLGLRTQNLAHVHISLAKNQSKTGPTISGQIAKILPS